jgi:maltose alpha-D-glucosyltransferase / alpha-amylase
MARQRHLGPMAAREGPGRVRRGPGGRGPRRAAGSARWSTLAKDPLWYKDAIIYEVHVRAFLDSNADGIGDFRGLTQSLDYLRDLGVTAVWLLPFYPSPLKDDGYDIADYYSINPIYGTLRDFRALLAQAHRRGLRIITELVVNHTSDQHPWFQRSRHAPPGSAWRDFYVWSPTPQRYGEARIIFRDFEPSNWSWDPVAQAYYWHRFYAHQPDLNYDNPLVHKEIRRVLDFWFGLGVDGLRLDAVPYLYEREGTSCENLPETHTYLKSLRRHVAEESGDRMLLAEANQWPEEAVTYFGAGKGDECHMAFHFPLMPRIFMAVRMEDRVPLVDILEQTPPIPETSQWALFLRNHDELTLEMVTDEERDYMYRVYANDARARLNLGIRRRLAPLLGNDRKRIELLYLLLFALPGTPVLYYGDEIGMGDNIFLGDRNGVRTPMQWSSDKNAGFSRASPHATYLPIILDPEYHYEAINVEAQQLNPNSLLWWMRRTLSLRKRYRAFGRGSLQFLHPENRKALAFIRHYQNENLLVVANLSRFPQPVQLNLAAYQNAVPLDLFGGTRFPSITAEPYAFTLSPHAAFWFSLEGPAGAPPERAAPRAEVIALRQDWTELFQDAARMALESALLGFLKRTGWAGNGERELKSVQLRDAIGLPPASSGAFLLLLFVEYVEGDPQEFQLPVAAVPGADSGPPRPYEAEDLVARIRFDEPGDEAAFIAAFRSRDFARALLEAIGRRRVYGGWQGELRCWPAAALRDRASEEWALLEPAFGHSTQNNLLMSFGEQHLLKLFRRLEPGLNPDLEMGRFLTQRNYPNIPPVAGWLEYVRRPHEPLTLGVLTRFVPNAHNAWTYTLDSLSRYFDRVQSSPADLTAGLATSLVQLSEREAPEPVVALIGTYLELARLLGQRTGELHLALASEPQNRDFAPEPFTPFYQRALFQSMRNLAVQRLELLRAKLSRLPESLYPSAQRVVALEPEIIKRFHAINQTRLRARRIRCHNDLHLGDVLYTGKDFLFIDFEGEPARPLGERRLKRSPLRDVAGMLRSFDYVSYFALLKQVELGAVQESQFPQLEPWTAFWCRWVSAAYLRGYFSVLSSSELLPAAPEQLSLLLEAFLLEKAVYELGYELAYRPDWVRIPLRGILQLLHLP